MLLKITAIVEALTGMALAIAPSSVVLLLLGSPLDSPAGLIVARVLAAALFSIGIACWPARNDSRGRPSTGLVVAMLVYNIAVAAILCHARIGLGLYGVGSLPAIIVHSALSVWCVASLRLTSPLATERPSGFDPSRPPG